MILTCKELVELVTHYLEGALDVETRARFDAHLAECKGCTAYLEQMHKTILLTKRLREDDLAQPARDELLNVFRNWRA